MNEQNNEKLESIVYISIPGHLDRTIGDFQLNPEIMLPLETNGSEQSWDIRDISWEMILSGMLKVLAYDRYHDDIDYFRDFVLAVKPNIVSELTEAAILKAKNGDFELAEEIFRALIGLQPNDQRALLNLALLYEQKARDAQGRGDDDTHSGYAQLAFEQYTTILQSDEVMPEVHLNVGYFYLEERNFDSAMAHFNAYVEEGSDPEKVKAAQKVINEIGSQNLLDTLFKEAYDFIRMGREQEGIEKIQEFLRTYPNIWNGWFLLGWGYRRMAKYEDAKQAFKKALETGPRQPDTLNELAICQMELGEYTDSEKALHEALRKEPENVKIISNLGILALKQDDVDEARAYFESALEFEPEDPIALQYLAKMEQDQA